MGVGVGVCGLSQGGTTPHHTHVCPHACIMWAYGEGQRWGGVSMQRGVHVVAVE